MVAGVRHANKGPLGEEHPVVQQERVIHYSKRVKLWWQRLGVNSNVTVRQEGLDDVMVFDVSFLMKHMQPARKTLARCSGRQPPPLDTYTMTASLYAVCFLACPQHAHSVRVSPWLIHS